MSKFNKNFLSDLIVVDTGKNLTSSKYCLLQAFLWRIWNLRWRILLIRTVPFFSSAVFAICPRLVGIVGSVALVSF